VLENETTNSWQSSIVVDVYYVIFVLFFNRSLVIWITMLFSCCFSIGV
jgi:hypothetical protein